MTELQEHQFEILPDADADDGFVFGIGAKVSISADGGFDPGETPWLTQDSQNTRRGVNAFGRDVLGADTWTWSSHVNETDVASARETLEAFKTAWRPEALAREPGLQTAIRYRLGDEHRRVFGRPRRFAAPPSNLILSGNVPVDHDFQLVDSFTYDDVEQSQLMPFSTSVVGGGMTFPITLPLVSDPAEANGSYQLTVGGTARVYPIIRFNGPWTNPSFSTEDWRLTWNGGIPAGQWVEIDTRPWMLTVLNQSGASVAGGIPKRTWLEDMWFSPGSSPQISLGGTSPGGGASALVRWRDTYNSY